MWNIFIFIYQSAMDVFPTSLRLWAVIARKFKKNSSKHWHSSCETSTGSTLHLLNWMSVHFVSKFCAGTNGHPGSTIGKKIYVSILMIILTCIFLSYRRFTLAPDIIFFFFLLIGGIILFLNHINGVFFANSQIKLRTWIQIVFTIYYFRIYKTKL